MKRKHISKGISLVEVIIGMTLLTLILMVAVMVYTSSIYISVRAGGRTQNVSIASGIAENSIANTTILFDEENKTVQIGEDVIHNATYFEETSRELKVLFKGEESNNKVLEDVSKITIETEKNINDSYINTVIEVYRPWRV